MVNLFFCITWHFAKGILSAKIPAFLSEAPYLSSLHTTGRTAGMPKTTIKESKSIKLLDSFVKTVRKIIYKNFEADFMSSLLAHHLCKSGA